MTTMNNPTRALGCIKDKYNPEDILMRGFLLPKSIPAKKSYREESTPVKDQLDAGFCAGFSCVGVQEYYNTKEYKRPVILSDMDAYLSAKEIDGMPGVEGTTIASVLSVFKKRGVCLESSWPYSPHEKTHPHIPNNYAERRKHRIVAYARIMSLDDLRVSLAQQGPCVAGVKVFKGMMNAAYEGGYVKMPKWFDRCLGLHALDFTGYNDETAFIETKGSWGPDSGDKGYFYLSYDYIQKYMVDAWSMVDFIDPNPMRLKHVKKAA